MVRIISSYEQEWLASTNPEDMVEYKRHTIFRYVGGYTYWFGENDGDYVSSIPSIEQAKQYIDEELRSESF